MTGVVEGVYTDLSNLKRIRVMISSRVNDEVKFCNQPARLGDVREEIKRTLEAAEFLSDPLLEIWINDCTA